MAQDRRNKPERRWLTRLMHVVFRFTRPMTLGVRAIVLDPDKGVFLVRHTYVPGWHFPGGGVEVGETLAEAAEKEMREEGNLVSEGPAELHGVFFNRLVSKRDHVVVFIYRAARQTAPFTGNAEIAEARFFALDALPEGITRGTQRRLDEVLQGAPRSVDW
jgi:ADP-ribose pyrophosphatase YjhB (NUDIX family)